MINLQPFGHKTTPHFTSATIALDGIVIKVKRNTIYGHFFKCPLNHYGTILKNGNMGLLVINTIQKTLNLKAFADIICKILHPFHLRAH